MSQFQQKSGKPTHTAPCYADEVNPMLFGGQKSREVWQRITTPKSFAQRIGACSTCIRRELYESCIFPSCSPRDQLHRSARGARNSPPFAGAIADFPSTRGY